MWLRNDDREGDRDDHHPQGKGQNQNTTKDTQMPNNDCVEVHNIVDNEVGADDRQKQLCKEDPKTIMHNFHVVLNSLNKAKAATRIGRVEALALPMYTAYSGLPNASVF